MLVRNCHNDANGDKKDGADAQSEKQAVPREMNGVTDLLVIGDLIVEQRSYYSTTNMPTAVMLTNVKRYQVIGASLYLFMRRLWTSS